MSTSVDTLSNALLIIGLLFAISRLREREVRPSRMWLTPVLLLLLVLPTISPVFLTGPIAICMMVLGFLVGAGLGAYRASLMTFRLDGNSGKIMVKGSLIYVISWGAITVVKIVGEYLLTGGGLVDLDLLTSIFPYDEHRRRDNETLSYIQKIFRSNGGAAL